MAEGTARLLLLAVLTLAIGACAGRADAAYEYRGTWFGEPEDALAHIRGEGCRTDRFWAATAYGRWIPWFETDVAAANDLFRETFVPFPPDNVPLNGGDILAWCGGQPPTAVAPTQTPAPTPVTEPRDPREGLDLSAARARVEAAQYNDEAYWSAYEFTDAELDELTTGVQSMPFLPVPFCTIQGERPAWASADEFRGWVRDAERIWDEAGEEDVIEYLGDCAAPLDADPANGRWSTERIMLQWGIALENSKRIPHGIRSVIRFADLADRWGEAGLGGGRSGLTNGVAIAPPSILLRISDEAPSSRIRGIIIHELGHALTLRHTGSPGERMWSKVDDPVRVLRDLTPSEAEDAEAGRLSAREAAILRAAIARVRAAPHTGYDSAFIELHAIQYDRELRRMFGASPSTEYDPEFDRDFEHRIN